MSVMRTIILVLLAALAIVGCAVPERPYVVWPLPPDQPRIQFLGNYYSQNDFTKTSKQIFFEGFSGQPPGATFDTPYGVAVDSAGRIYVSDLHAHNLRVYDMTAKTVNYYLKKSPFDAPRGLDVDAADQLYVADLNKGIMVFSPERELLRIIGQGIVSKPVGVAVTPDGSIVYVADGGKLRIFAFDGHDGKLLASCGTDGGGESSLLSPQGVAIGPDGNLYVADSLGARIVVFSPDGTYLRRFGVRGDRPYEFEGPKDLAFDSEGHLWITDYRGARVGIYNRDNGDLFLSVGDARRSSAPLGFSTPAGIFIDRQDRVYIVDSINKRFGIWQYFSTSYLAEHPITDAERKKLEPYLKTGSEAQKKEAGQAPK